MIPRALLVVGSACVLALVREPLAAPLRETAFAGVRLRDNPEGLVVGSVRPGPFSRGDAPLPLLRRNDLIVSVNGNVVDAAGFDRVVEGSKPGDEMTIVLRRGKPADPLAALPVGDPAGEEVRLTVKLASAEEWTGTLGRGRVDRATGDEKRERTPLGERIVALAQQTGTWADSSEGRQLESLLGSLRGVQERARDSFGLPAIRACFEDPVAVDGIESGLFERIRVLAAHPDERAIEQFVKSVLIMQEPVGTPPSEEEAMRLARHLRDSVSIDGPESKQFLATINAAPAGVWRWVVNSSGWRNRELWNERLRLGAATTPCADLPPELRESVTGDILYYEKLENGRYAVAGADGVNTYDMDLIEIVYDLGGNDIYWFGGTDRASCANHLITDISGNDEYISEADFRGPGVAINGFSLIEDRQGNDIYRSARMGSVACGLFGVGVIIDRSGNDRYENTGPDSGWALGAAIDGVGMVIDLAGDDQYAGEKLTQGAAGPFAFGAIIDASGNDVYTADGPSFASAYNTPGTFLSMSQGFSMGVRGYASGGIGAIYDLAGNDRYAAGEFSQGCGYAFSLGILHDAGGDEIYNGNRYSQAAAAHQAVGVLIDDEGNDRYVAKTAAGQSGAWDQSITLLVDRAGDDQYEGDDLCQGAAAQQAVSFFFDLEGLNRYSGSGASVQGMSGGNEYHFNTEKVMSFSLFSGVGESSSGRNGVVRTGRVDPEVPERSRAWGVFAGQR